MKLLRQQEQVIDFNREYSRFFRAYFSLLDNLEKKYEESLRESLVGVDEVIVKKIVANDTACVELFSSSGANNKTVNFSSFFGVKSGELQVAIAKRLIVFYENMLLQDGYEQVKQQDLDSHEYSPSGTWETCSCWRRQ